MASCYIKLLRPGGCFISVSSCTCMLLVVDSMWRSPYCIVLRESYCAILWWEPPSPLKVHVRICECKKKRNPSVGFVKTFQIILHKQVKKCLRLSLVLAAVSYSSRGKNHIFKQVLKAFRCDKLFTASLPAVWKDFAEIYSENQTS